MPDTASKSQNCLSIHRKFRELHNNPVSGFSGPGILIIWTQLNSHLSQTKSISLGSPTAQLCQEYKRVQMVHQKRPSPQCALCATHLTMAPYASLSFPIRGHDVNSSLAVVGRQIQAEHHPPAARQPLHGTRTTCSCCCLKKWFISQNSTSKASQRRNWRKILIADF